MLAFPMMLIPAAKEAGMPIPEDADNFDSNEFPHFQVFCTIQLGRPMVSMDEHWVNAEVIAAIPLDEIKTVTLNDLIARGLSCQT